MVLIFTKNVYKISILRNKNKFKIQIKKIEFFFNIELFNKNILDKKSPINKFKEKNI